MHFISSKRLMRIPAFITLFVVALLLSHTFYVSATEVENSSLLTGTSVSVNINEKITDAVSSSSVLKVEKQERTEKTELKTEVKVEKKIEKDFFREFLAFFGFSFVQLGGVVGEVVAYDPPYITLLDKKENEQHVVTMPLTRILLNKATTTTRISTSTIDVGDTMIVLGKMNRRSLLEAKLIKIVSKKEIIVEDEIKDTKEIKEDGLEKVIKVEKVEKVEKIKEDVEPEKSK